MLTKEQAHSLVDRLIDGNSVMIPEELRDQLPEISRKKRGRELAVLIWLKIASTERFIRGPVAINNDRFLEIGCEKEAVSRAKKGLQSRGFIDFSQSYKTTVRPKRYWAKGHSRLVEFQLTEDWKGRQIRHTEDDEACQHTRNTLDLIDVDLPQIKLLFAQRILDYLVTPDSEKWGTKGGDNDGREKNLHCLAPPVTQLFRKVGNVRRSREYRRLFSPLTNLKSEFRECIRLEGEQLVCLDMVEAQPTLLGCISNDRKLVETCQRGELYLSIADLLGVERKAAQTKLFEYLFARNKTNSKRNPTAYRVQEFFRKEFPIAASYAWNKKVKNHRRLSHTLQRIEAEIFVDGMLIELKRANTPAVTIHDSIVVEEKYQEQATKIAKRHLEKHNIKTELKIEKIQHPAHQGNPL